MLVSKDKEIEKLKGHREESDDSPKTDSSRFEHTEDLLDKSYIRQALIQYLKYKSAN